MNKIKPCPFCGTEVELSKNPLWQGSHGYYNCFEFKIICSKCGCNVTYNKNDTIYRSEEEAIQNVIEAWNKRNESNNTASIDKIRAEIENHCGLTKENHCRYCSYCNNVMGVREILEIIDKSKTESEG